MGYYLKLAAAKTEVRPFTTDVPAATEAGSSPPPLWDNLGKLHFAVSTKNPLAQRYFDQGMKLAYAFNHAEAARAFRQAQAWIRCARATGARRWCWGRTSMPHDEAANAAALHPPRRRRWRGQPPRTRSGGPRRHSRDPKAERGASTRPTPRLAVLGALPARWNALLAPRR
jgi:hypothetical protein